MVLDLDLLGMFVQLLIDLIVQPGVAAETPAAGAELPLLPQSASPAPPAAGGRPQGSP